MKAIQDSVAAYLQACTGVRTVADRTRARGEYPLLAVSVREDGTVLVDGGRPSVLLSSENMTHKRYAENRILTC